MSSVKLLNDGNFTNEVESNSGAVMVDFSADWCAPCQILAPKIEEIANEYKGKAKVAKFDVDQSLSVPMRFGIRGIPTVLFFKGGILVDQVVGLVRKEELTSRLDSLLAGTN
ncbi:MAG TPA: thioredoxin [archaeon]|nr:thioredoxin [archaeon]